MSWLSRYVFDPIKMVAARLAGSSNPSTAAAGQAVQATIQTMATDAVTGLTGVMAGSNSPAGLGSKLLGDFENGLNGTVEAFVTSAVPIVGPELAIGAEALMVFAEQHAHDYIAGLFAHHKTTYSAAVAAKALSQPSA